jgi:hypothetical protein
VGQVLWREEDFAALEKLPDKNHPLTSYNPREPAWTLVEEGLMKAIKKLQAHQPKTDGRRMSHQR